MVSKSARSACSLANKILPPPPPQSPPFPPPPRILAFARFHFMLKFHASDAAPAAGAQQASRSLPGLLFLRLFTLLSFWGAGALRLHRHCFTLQQMSSPLLSSPPLPFRETLIAFLAMASSTSTLLLVSSKNTFEPSSSCVRTRSWQDSERRDSHNCPRPYPHRKRPSHPHPNCPAQHQLPHSTCCLLTCSKHARVHRDCPSCPSPS